MMTDDKTVRSIHADNLARLAPRAADSHKSQLGHVFVIAGDFGRAGASLFSAQTALRCGAVYLALCLRACAGERLACQGRGLMASAMCDSIRLLLEEQNPCQA